MSYYCTDSKRYWLHSQQCWVPISDLKEMLQAMSVSNLKVSKTSDMFVDLLMTEDSIPEGMQDHEVRPYLQKMFGIDLPELEDKPVNPEEATAAAPWYKAIQTIFNAEVQPVCSPNDAEAPASKRKLVEFRKNVLKIYD